MARNSHFQLCLVAKKNMRKEQKGKPKPWHLNTKTHLSNQTTESITMAKISSGTSHTTEHVYYIFYTQKISRVKQRFYLGKTRKKRELSFLTSCAWFGGVPVALPPSRCCWCRELWCAVRFELDTENVSPVSDSHGCIRKTIR